MKKILLPFFVIALYSCNGHGENEQSGNINAADTNLAVSTNTPLQPERPDTGIYSIQLINTRLFLQQWASTINLEKELGKPGKQKTKQLDSNSDTFSGSFIKDLEYDGLKLKLFSPPQNGRTFWIQEIILTNNKYKTTKGIGIGDGLDKVKQAYPYLEKFPGNNENMFYVADEGYEKSIEMEFEKNKLKKLRMYYMLN